VAAKAIPAAAAWHGRLLVLDSEAAKESTGHGSPLPQLKHGGPGRAGGGEELGGLRAVKHYLQRAAVQGSPTMLMAVTGEYVRGAKVIETDVHPFRRYFQDLQIGESLLTHRRTVTEADLVNFGCLSGITSTCTSTTSRPRHRSSASASPTAISCCRRRPVCSFRRRRPGAGQLRPGYLALHQPGGHRRHHQARLTCKRKIDQGKTSPQGHPQGVVAWDVEVTNQLGELVASYDILTLVAKRED
jgi:oxepin-CoA hydrolase/3-oxo-5,6-dehydrosuberyl-CoA semialdehyde dehydrogenase